ncbi:MAG: hypothetical protein JXA28_10670 [Bacteroidetes bacterium]|nr:hypothetical protein [Bacteroidota bacterium]
MGTQQLLLVVLGVIIVGAAVAIALFIFGTNADQANKDALTQDCLHLASAAQGYFSKPSMLGGGSNAFDGLRITDCGMRDNGSGDGENLSGTFSILKAEGQNLTIQAISSSNPAQMVTLTLDMTQQAAEERIEILYDGW